MSTDRFRGNLLKDTVSRKSLYNKIVVKVNIHCVPLKIFREINPLKLFLLWMHSQKDMAKYGRRITTDGGSSSAKISSTERFPRREELVAKSWTNDARRKASERNGKENGPLGRVASPEKDSLAAQVTFG